MSSLPIPRLQSTRCEDGSFDRTPDLHWARGEKIAVVTLAGGEQFLVAKRVRHTPTDTMRWALYWDQTDSKSASVELLTYWKTLARIMQVAEERAANGEFGGDSSSWPNQSWRERRRYTAKLVKKMARFKVEYRPGMTVGEATDLIVIAQISEVMHHYFVQKRAA